jgi:benzoyl-CoA reductase/2-hydroxyglutaryl-CoA dehydratase subunit BcrC/BadD/HgdB
LGIKTPLKIGELTTTIIDNVSKQFEDLVWETEKVSTEKFDIDKFRETTRLSLEAAILWRKILETGKHKPSPINFFDAAIHMGPIVVMRGTQYAVDYYKILLAELENRIKNNISAVSSEKIRIYWEGMPLWYKLSGMAKLFAGLETCVVASTYCNSWIFDDLDPNNPFRSAALAYCKLFITRTDDEKQKVLANLSDDFSCNGIIYHDSKTCSRNSNNRFGLPVRLQEQTKIPYLEINGDLCDSRCFSEEQAVIAIETFVSQLRSL